MSYNYTQLNEIIETQYSVVTSKINDNSFFNQTAKLLKGYSNPRDYLSSIMSSSKGNKEMEEYPPLYIDR